MIRGRRAHGAALATLATCAHLSPDNQARLHRAGSVPCKQDPKTLKMSAYGTLSPYCATTPRVLPTPWALPTRVRHVAGVRGKPPAPLPQALGRLQPVKAKPQAVASQALTGFQLRPLRIVLLLSRRWRGVKGGEAVHFTLDALEPTQHFATGSGGWVLTACPCGATMAGVWGKAPVLTQERPQWGRLRKRKIKYVKPLAWPPLSQTIIFKKPP